MTLKEFLQQLNNGEFTFTIARAVKDEHTPLYHNEFRQTSIRDTSEWKEWDRAKDYIVINPDSCPIDISGTWQNWYKVGRINCAIITTEKDLYTEYSEKQAKDMIKYYDKKVKEWLKNKKR